MINAYKGNNRLLKGRRKLKEILQGYTAKPSNPILIKKDNIEEMNRFRSRLRKDKKQNQRRMFLILGLTIIISLVLLYWVITADYSDVIRIID